MGGKKYRYYINKLKRTRHGFVSIIITLNARHCSSMPKSANSNFGCDKIYLFNEDEEFSRSKID